MKNILKYSSQIYITLNQLQTLEKIKQIEYNKIRSVGHFKT